MNQAVSGEQAAPIRVVATGNVPSSFPVDAFRDRVEIAVAHTDEELRTAVREASVLWSWQVPETVPEETPQLRWIQLPSAGADHVRHLPVWNSEVTITSSKGIHTVPMAEHVFAMLLALVRQLGPMVRAQERHEWLHNWRGQGLRFTELRGKTMGILGWGKIGDGVAHIGRAFGMRVIGTRWSVVVPREVPSEGCGAYSDPPWLEPTESLPNIVYPSAQLHDVLSQSDVVVVILPLTDETNRLLSDKAFQSMRRGAIFLNIGRGPVVDERALVRALQTGRVAAAGLDVFDEEPLPRSSPLWGMPNVIISPHVGGVGDHTRERGARFFAVNLARYLDGQPLLNVVNRKQEY